MERNLTLSLELASKIYKTANNEIKIILENTFPELKENKYPMSHAELQDILIKEKKDVSYICGTSIIKEKYTLGDNTTGHKNISLTSTRSRQHLAFIQLVALRDKWNEIDEFKPDWENHQEYKYCIEYTNNEIESTKCRAFSRILAFKTEETRDLFLKTFKDLIKIAKTLI